MLSVFSPEVTHFIKSPEHGLISLILQMSLGNHQFVQFVNVTLNFFTTSLSDLQIIKNIYSLLIFCISGSITTYYLRQQTNLCLYILFYFTSCQWKIIPLPLFHHVIDEDFWGQYYQVAYPERAHVISGWYQKLRFSKLGSILDRPWGYLSKSCYSLFSIIFNHWKLL